MYRILLLNLPGPVLKAGSRWYNVSKTSVASIRYYPYPWFMGYATSLLKENGFEAVLKDAVAMEWSFEETLNYVADFKPDFIVCEPTWISIQDDSRLLGSVGQTIRKIAVGNYATNYPLECFEKSRAHYVVVGEYEFALLEFFQSGCVKIPKNFVSEAKRSYEMPDLVQDLDIFPFPERDDTPTEFYNEPSCYGKNIVMVSSRGCRLKCDFCNVECIYGTHAYRTRTAQNVVDEMEYLRENYEFDEIYFDDDNMVSRKSHIDDLCSEIIRRGVKVKWLCMGDGLIDDETLELLAKAGCTTYKFGLEHLDAEVLRAIPKPYKKERLFNIIKKCRELRLRSYVNLIVGLPKSNWEKDLQMIKEVIQAGPDFVQLAIATPYPGTAFHKKAKQNGWLVSEDPECFDATGRSAVSYPDYPAQRIEEMFHLGWRLWYRHVFLKKPSTLLFFFRSEVRRNGLINTLKKGLAYVLKTL